MSEHRRKRALTAEEATTEILRFLDEELEGDGDDFDELYHDDDLVDADEDNIATVANQSEGDLDETALDACSPRLIEATRKRKKLTWMRLVNSINSALDPDNFDSMVLPAGDDQRTIIGYLGPKKNPNTDKIIWTQRPPSGAGRQSICNVLGGSPGSVKGDAKSVSTPREAFELFINHIMISDLVSYTNARIAETKEKIGDIANQYPFKSYI
eukprot:Seg4924.3 transcript_id=Seg4924.3/GoldUCD/mRNA.D3Y31 product="hypothetical protein" protein_id=Seg4924.3/GoldUCD/D3Y31